MDVKFDNLCAVCTEEIPECDRVNVEFKSDSDSVCNCESFKKMSNEEIWFLHKCRNILRRMSREEYCFKFHVHSRELCLEFADIYGSLFKDYDKKEG